MTDDLKRLIEQARQELRLTEKAFAGLEEAMMAEMFITSAEQTVKREKLFFGVRAIRMAREALFRAVSDGEAVTNYQTLLAETGFTNPNT